MQRWLKTDLVQVNVTVRPASYRVRAGDTVSLTVPPPEPSPLTAQDLPLDVVFEDRDIIVVNKPPGLVVHPGAGHREGTLLNALLHHCPDLQEIGDASRPGLVHRLDKDTSGLIVVAKTALAHAALVSQFQARQVAKRYLALVWGRMPGPTGEIAGEIGRHPTDRQKMSVHARRGKEAVTLWRVLREFPGPLTLLELTPKTGRTHQLRVHLTSLGHPILGDTAYGGGLSRLKSAPSLKGLTAPRQMLHAAMLSFTHPRTGGTVGWEAEVPEDFQRVLAFLDKAL
jgi:23S rRNA pseudouridine1911/1915/1917 synthase